MGHKGWVSSSGRSSRIFSWTAQRGNKDKAAGPGTARRLDQADRPQDVCFDEGDHVPFAAAEAAAGMVEGRVDHRVATADQVVATGWVGQIALNPLQAVRLRRSFRSGLKTAAIARRTVPATKPMPLAGEVRGDVPPDEARRSCECDLHNAAEPTTKAVSPQLSAIRKLMADG